MCIDKTSRLSSTERVWQLRHPSSDEHAMCRSLVCTPFSMEGTRVLGETVDSRVGKWYTEAEIHQWARTQGSVQKQQGYIRKTRKWLLLPETEFIYSPKNKSPKLDNIQETMVYKTLDIRQQKRTRWEMGKQMKGPYDGPRLQLQGHSSGGWTQAQPRHSLSGGARAESLGFEVAWVH